MFRLAASIHPRWLDALALSAGTAVPLAFAPQGLWPIAYVCLLLLYAVWMPASPRRAAWRGGLFGLGMFGVGVSWVQVSIHQFGLPDLWFSGGVTVGFVMLLAAFPAAVGYLARRFFPDAWLLAWPALWVMAEWLRSWIFSGFPWLLLGYSQIDAPPSAVAPLFGALGVGATVAVTASLLLALFTPRYRRAGLIALPLLWLVMWPLGTLSWSEATGRSLQVAAVQGNVPQRIKWKPEQRQRTQALYAELSKPLWGRDLVIWPETAIPAFSFEVQDYLQGLSAAADARGSGFLVGIPVMEPDGRYFNSILGLGRARGRYDKRHLVPFGEYLPLRRWTGALLAFLSIPMSQFSQGDWEQPLLQVGDGVLVGTSICYEDAYGPLMALALPDAQLLVNVSNDAWFGDSLAPHQHLEIARMRAREAERALVRATNTGISAIIDHRGKVRGVAPQFQTGVVTGEVQLRAGLTPYGRWRGWPAVLCSLVVLLAALSTALRQGRQRHD